MLFRQVTRLETVVVIHVADGGVGTWERQGNPIQHQLSRPHPPQGYLFRRGRG